MPLVKRKVVELVPPPKTNPNEDPEVFLLEVTGEIFTDYETYANRLTFYNQRLFQCELTGKVNLTYFEATESEKQEAIMLHKRFPEPLKGPVLRSVQFQVTGRLDNLVDFVFDRFKDRFYNHESVFIELHGDKYYARIREVLAPKSAVTAVKSHTHIQSPNRQSVKSENGNDKSSDAGDSDTEDSEFTIKATNDEIHRVGTNLDLGPAEANKLDNPLDYVYHIQLVDDQGTFTGDLIQVSADKLSRDRLGFSKTILRKYIRDCVIRASNIGAPWIVKQWLSKKYQIATSPSDETLQRNEMIKDAKLLKRKKLTTDGEESGAAIKKSKMEAKKAAAAEKKKKAEEEKAALEKLKEEERLKAEKKKNLKYPIEDLELDPISSRELKHQVVGELPRRKERPIPARGSAALPVAADVFEEFIVTYTFLTALGKPLGISPFTLDDYENALRHKTHEPLCTLIAEVHSVLLNAIIRDGSHSRDLAPAAMASRAAGTAPGSVAPSEDGDHAVAMESRAGSAVDELDEGSEDIHGQDASVQAILQAAKELSKGWEKKILRGDQAREGWEIHLIGCLAKRADPETFPRLVGILSHLTSIEHRDGYIDGQWIADTYFNPADRYPVLEVGDKVHIISFLCNLAVMTKPVRSFFDDCETQVTELRKERVELGREKRKLAELREAFEEGKKQEAQKKELNEDGEEVEGDAPLPAEDDDDVVVEEAVEEDEEEEERDEDMESEKDELLSDSEEDETASTAAAATTKAVSSRRRISNESKSAADMSDSGSERFRKALGSRQQALRQKAIQREAKEAARVAELKRAREAHRVKVQESKQLNAERRKLEEEETRLGKREEAMEREFRKLLLAARLVPLGKDRFCDRYWWFDGIGSSSLTGGGGSVLYQTGRLFIQGPSEEDFRHLVETNQIKQLTQRKREELGDDVGILAINEWAVYTEPEQIEELLSWLRVKGTRENQLKNHILKFRYYLEHGMRKRNNDILFGHLRDGLETRRSSRTKSSDPCSSSLRLPYMTWKNTFDKSK